MNRLCGIHIDSTRGKLRPVFNNIRRDLLAPHSPRGIGICAVCLLVHIVSPATYALTDKQADSAHIEKIQNVNLSDLADYKRCEQTADNAAVNGKSAVPYGEYLAEMLLVVAPLEYDIVESCADYARDGAIDEDIEHFIKADAPFIRHSAAEKSRKQKAECNYHAVKFDADVQTENRKFGKSRRNIKSPVNARKIYGCVVGHFSHPFILKLNLWTDKRFFDNFKGRFSPYPHSSLP